MKDIKMNFNDFGLSPALMTSLSKIGYSTPTPIQEKAIPLALQGHDILGSAQTGTGKTAAFAIPLVEALLQSPDNAALVLTPTRELAKQVLTAIRDLLGRDSGINTAFIIGGEHMGKQYTQLRANPRIIVGTPGRINDHLERGTIKLDKTNFLVLDETDRMLDMGFDVQLEKIINFLPKQRQTLMFSATLPDSIVKLSGQYLNSPKRISVGETNIVATNIKQEVLRIEQGDKYQELQIQLNERQGSVIVFVKTKHNADKMAKKLRQDGFTSEALHGDLRQNKRDKVMRNFRDMNFRVLIATDIAARGLDVPHIEHVINYDLPQVAEDYIHRMGRTARAGAKGSAISFVASQDSRKWHAIECLLFPDMKREKPPASGKNKARRKPYRGRPESKNTQKSGAYKSGPHKPAHKSEGEGAGTQAQKPNKPRKPFKGGKPAFAKSGPAKSDGQKRDHFKGNASKSRASKSGASKSGASKPGYSKPNNAKPNKKNFTKRPKNKSAA